MKTSKVLAILGTVLTVLSAWPAIASFIPDEWRELVTTIIGSVTAIIVAVGDKLDDGKINGSFFKRGANVIALFLIGAVLFAFWPGCTPWKGKVPDTDTVINTTKKVLNSPLGKLGTQIALNFLVDELDDRVKELRPYLPGFKVAIQESLTFSPPEAASKINDAIAELPADYQSQVRAELLAQMQQVAEAEPSVSSSPDGPTTTDTYGNQLYAALADSK